MGQLNEAMRRNQGMTRRVLAHPISITVVVVPLLIHDDDIEADSA